MIRLFSFFGVFLILSVVLLSCGFFTTTSRHKTNDHAQTPFPNRFFKLDNITLKHNGEKIKQLLGFIRDSTGKKLSYYSVSNKCGCVHKNILTKQELKGDYLYKLTTELLPDIIPLDKEDTFVFRKFLEYKGIREFCTKELLDSAKGFYLVKKDIKKTSR